MQSFHKHDTKSLNKLFCYKLAFGLFMEQHEHKIIKKFAASLERKILLAFFVHWTGSMDVTFRKLEKSFDEFLILFSLEKKHKLFSAFLNDRPKVNNRIKFQSNKLRQPIKLRIRN